LIQFALTDGASRCLYLLRINMRRKQMNEIRHVASQNDIPPKTDPGRTAREQTV
jgi:hypothetical protein